MPSSSRSYHVFDKDWNPVSNRVMDYAAAIQFAERFSRARPGHFSVSEEDASYTVAQYENGQLISSNPVRK